MDMKKLWVTVLLIGFGLSYASAQRNVDQTKLTQEQRLVQRNAKHKNGGRSADLSKRVQRARKQDRASRKIKAPKNRRTPKRK